MTVCGVFLHAFDVSLRLQTSFSAAVRRPYDFVAGISFNQARKCSQPVCTAFEQCPCLSADREMNMIRINSGCRRKRGRRILLTADIWDFAIDRLSAYMIELKNVDDKS